MLGQEHGRRRTRCSPVHPEGADLVETARIAGVMAAKRTPDLVPLCHPLLLDGFAVDVDVVPGGFAVLAVVSVADRTGVEMEALTACAAAALVLVQALLDVDPRASVEDLTLWHKSGGRSGVWERPAGGLRHPLEPRIHPSAGCTMAVDTAIVTPVDRHTRGSLR